LPFFSPPEVAFPQTIAYAACNLDPGFAVEKNSPVLDFAVDWD